MGFGVRIVDEVVAPAAGCDHCGAEAGPYGYVLWRASVAPSPVLVACDAGCLEALAEGEDSSAPGWAAVQLDAYLAGLIRRLEIDLAAVEERERAAAATEHTRREGPE